MKWAFFMLLYENGVDICHSIRTALNKTLSRTSICYYESL